MNRIIFGGLETVNIAKLGIYDVTAKVDTGAWSGALHCTNIKEKDNVLYFAPLGDEKLAISTKDFTKRAVRSASGHEQTRYVIPVVLEISGQNYHTMLGLSDRSEMQREMLLGRKFLIENNILVDVTLTLEDDYEAEKYL
jgi:hypothetical protein